MKKINSIISMFLSFVYLSCLFSCAQGQEELTEIEVAAVGRWELTEIRSLYTKYEMGRDGNVYLANWYQYCYPNIEGNPNGLATDKLFNIIVEKYWGNTWFELKDNKSEGWLEGCFYDVNGETHIKWQDGSAGFSISSLSFDAITDGPRIKSTRARSLIWDGDEGNEIRMYASSAAGYLTTYFFKKTDNN